MLEQYRDIVKVFVTKATPKFTQIGKTFKKQKKTGRTGLFVIREAWQVEQRLADRGAQLHQVR